MQNIFGENQRLWSM